LVSIQDLLFPPAITTTGGSIQLLAYGPDGEGVVEKAQSFQEGITIQGWHRGPVRLLDEKVEVIGHHRVGDDAEPEKSLELAHEDHEMLPFRVSEDELPVNDPGNAVVVAEPFSPDACLPHDRE
jgi:hypothetical protein